MKFERLRLSGFKTFVEPVELAIAPGLTGVVGPNGCGKSNLVEALRWAMGETSSKSLRGAGMDDVIFAGSTTRPARNFAEVSLRIGAPPPDLPGHLHGAEAIEISRRIVREQGSTYRMNGREVRARDVQILFADAASGARSPSMVRQGQISEIISAKPQHRRRILEDAAGVAGLHTRRHEAELRLRGAEENLARLADILAQYERQKGDLKRQARQAERFKVLAARIRTLEIALLAAGYEAAKREAAEADMAHDTALRAEGAAMLAQGTSERERAVAEHETEAARRANNEAGATLATLSGGRAALDVELAHARSRLEELAQRRAEASRDAEVSGQVRRDAAEALAQGESERATLSAQLAMAQAQSAGLDAALTHASTARLTAEQALHHHQQRLAEAGAERRAAQQRHAEAEARAARLAGQKAALVQELAMSGQAEQEMAALALLAAECAALEAQTEVCRQAAERKEQALAGARAEEQALRPRLAEAERLAQRLETDARTIRKLVDNTEPGLWTPAVDRITVEPGYEAALAAALGEDLEAAIEPGAPRHWAEVALQDLPALPGGVPTLLAHVEAPGALHARLSQIGICAPEAGEALAAHLKPGQRLVSLAGDLWRWDGFAAMATAASPAARRMEERNRLGALETQARDARQKRDSARARLDEAQKALRRAQADEADAREARRRAEQAQATLTRTLSNARTAAEASRIRLEGTRARLEALTADGEEAARTLESARAALAALPEVMGEDDGLLAARTALETARKAENEARAALGNRQGEIDSAQARLAALAREAEAWQQRANRAEAGVAELAARVARLAGEEAQWRDVPDALAQRRLTLCDEIEAAGLAARAAGDTLALSETRLRDASQLARAALSTLADARAETARLEARREHAQQRLAEIIRAIETRLDGPVSSLPAMEPGSDPARIEAELLDLRHERERLGAVNLRAEIELCEIEKDHARLSLEQEDVEKAIAKLRRAIDSLNAEGRARLRAAFERVNAAFSKLFTRLFGGGTAQLQLVEAEDPLEAGLEILAHPPGKKPQWLSLLSGGEQALTATALIFAVFLTNPSPICVLDEVDAPLDDSNVERLCDLLADMAQETETRFLMITHNPISMARMDRLYGVTMVERGVSQIVSVDLQTAARFAEAG